MKLWMTRDRDNDRGPYVVYGNYINFWMSDPGKHSAAWGFEGESFESFSSIHKDEFKMLSSLPLPRKGSKRLVDVTLVIKEVR